MADQTTTKPRTRDERDAARAALQAEVDAWSAGSGPSQFRPDSPTHPFDAVLSLDGLDDDVNFALQDYHYANRLAAADPGDRTKGIALVWSFERLVRAINDPKRVAPTLARLERKLDNVLAGKNALGPPLLTVVTRQADDGQFLAHVDPFPWICTGSTADEAVRNAQSHILRHLADVLDNGTWTPEHTALFGAR